MSDTILTGVVLALTKSIGTGLSAIGEKGLNKIFKKSKKNKSQITDDFQKIFKDITDDTFSKCESTKIENVDNNKFYERIYNLGLDKDNLATLINEVKKEFSKDSKKLSEQASYVKNLDSEIEKKKSELKKLKENEKKELENKKKELEEKKKELENETAELNTVITDLENKKKNETEKDLKDKIEKDLKDKIEKVKYLESQHIKINNDIKNLSSNNTKSNSKENEIKDLEEKKNKNNLTVNCITSKTPFPVMDYEKIVFFLNTRLDKLIEDYEKYYNDEETKLKKIIDDCDTIKIEEYCNNPDNNDYRLKASNCYKVYQINNERLEEQSKKTFKELDTYELYCKKDEFKKDKLIKDINNYLESVINNHKLISNECKDAKCILSLMKNYEDNFKNFNVYLTGKFRGEDIYGEAPRMIKTLLMYNIDSIKDTDSNSDITNFFTNNSIKQDNLQNLKTVNYMTVLDIRKILRDWDTETKQLLDKIKSTKILKEQKQQKEEESKKREEEKRILYEKNRQEEAKRERKIMEQREKENKEQREKEQRIELERAKQREHERTIEALKGKSSYSSSSSSSSSSTDSTKSTGIGILMFTASAVLLGGVGIAFASK